MSVTLGKTMYKIHKWSGLIVGLFIFLLGVSGSILVFNQELEEYGRADYLKVDNTQPVDIDKAYQTVSSKFKNWDTRIEQFSENPSATLVFGLRRATQRLTVFVHPANGKILSQADSEKTIVKWILKLHYSLHAGAAGKTVVFISGCLFLISLITGLIIYRRAIVAVLLFKPTFSNKNKRAFASSLHRYVGVWAVFINLVIVISGLFISFDVMTNGFSAPKKQLPDSPAITTSLQKVLKNINQLHPAFEASYIRFPTSAEAPILILGKLENQPFYYSKTASSVNADATTGELLEFNPATQASPKAKIASISRAFHFVEFDNIFVKLLFCLAGLSVPMLSVTGFLLWKFKKRRALK